MLLCGAVKKPQPQETTDLGRCVELLESIALDPTRLASVDEVLRRRLVTAAGQVSRPDKLAKRAFASALWRRERDDRRRHDTAILERTGTRVLRRASVYPTPLPGATAAPPPRKTRDEELYEPRKCYVCKVTFNRVHFFYDSMCPSCADLNWTKRHQTADVAGRVALVTGARVKIGYQAAIMLLRAGARVIATTRFPRDAARRYAREPDFREWGDRLAIYGIDLRHTPSVETLCRELLDRFDRLDFIISNACQTVRRPVGFYDHLMDGETAPPSPAAACLLAHHEQLTATTALATRRLLVDSARASQVALIEEDRRRGPDIFPAGQLDADLQQVDLRDRNSWRLTLAEVPSVELLEVHLVNAVAPFVLNARLKPLMLRHPSRDKHIVNVSAMGGAVLSGVQDRQAPPHEHGEGSAQHDDAHVGGRLRARRHPHEQRRHGLGYRRGRGDARRAEAGDARLPPAAGRRRRRGAHSRSDLLGIPHRRAPLGLLLQGLQAGTLVAFCSTPPGDAVGARAASRADAGSE